MKKQIGLAALQLAVAMTEAQNIRDYQERFLRKEPPVYKNNTKKCKSCKSFVKESKYSCHCKTTGRSVEPNQPACGEHTKRK